jgi:hypothetical protein
VGNVVHHLLPPVFPWWEILSSVCNSPLHTSIFTVVGGRKAADHVETGNFEDFAKIPFGSERYGKEKWTGIGEFPKDV